MRCYRKLWYSKACMDVRMCTYTPHKAWGTPTLIHPHPFINPNYFNLRPPTPYVWLGPDMQTYGQQKISQQHRTTGDVAQMAEHLLSEQDIQGSNPCISYRLKPVPFFPPSAPQTHPPTNSKALHKCTTNSGIELTLSGTHCHTLSPSCKSFFTHCHSSS